MNGTKEERIEKAEHIVEALSSLVENRRVLVRAIGELERERDGYGEALGRARKEAGTLAAELSEARNEAQSLRERLDAELEVDLDAELADARAERNAARARLEEVIAAHRGAEAEVVELRTKLSVAREALRHAEGVSMAAVGDAKVLRASLKAAHSPRVALNDGTSAPMSMCPFAVRGAQSGAHEPQPPPTEGEGDVWLELIDEEPSPTLREAMKARRGFGIDKYGTPLQRENGRDALADAQEEALDGMAYSRSERCGPAETAFRTAWFALDVHRGRVTTRGPARYGD